MNPPSYPTGVAIFTLINNGKGSGEDHLHDRHCFATVREREKEKEKEMLSIGPPSDWLWVQSSSSPNCLRSDADCQLFENGIGYRLISCNFIDLIQVDIVAIILIMSIFSI